MTMKFQQNAAWKSLLCTLMASIALFIGACSLSDLAGNSKKSTGAPPNDDPPGDEGGGSANLTT